MQSIQEIRKKYPQYKDMSDQQLASALHKKYYSDIPENDFYQKVGIKNNAPTEPKKADSLLDKLDAAAIMAGKGILDVGRGAKQLALEANEKTGGKLAKLLPGYTKDLYKLATGGETAKSYRDKINREVSLVEDLPQVKENPLSAKAGEIAGGVLATLPAGAASLPLAAGKTALQQAGKVIGTGAIQGGLAGGLMYDPEGGLAGHAQNAALGSAIGGALPASFLGAQRIIKGKGAPDIIAKTQELGQLSKEHGIDLTVPELRGSVGGKYVESLLEKVPGSGYIGMREAQSEQFKNAADKLRQEIGRETKKEEGAVLIKSLQKREEAAKSAASKKFDLVDRVAQAQGNPPVAFNNLKKTAQEIINSESNLPVAQRNQNIINTARNYLSMDKVSFDMARKIRSRLGSETSQLDKASNMGTVQKEEHAVASKLFGAMEKDIDDFASQNGGTLKQVYTNAKQFYKDKVVPFSRDELRKAVKGDYDKDQVVGAFLRPGREELASTLVNNVGAKGLEASRAAILNNAYEKAMQGEFFNPGMFSKEALRLGKANNVLFTDAQRKSLEGYAKLAKAAERVSKFAANPETGSRLAGPLAVISGGAAAAFSPTVGLGILSGLGLAKLMRSEIGRKLLTRASNLPENAKKETWEKLLADAGKLVPTVAATQSSPLQEEL
jgi:hypothetical protein